MNKIKKIISGRFIIEENIYNLPKLEQNLTVENFLFLKVKQILFFGILFGHT